MGVYKNLQALAESTQARLDIADLVCEGGVESLTEMYAGLPVPVLKKHVEALANVLVLHGQTQVHFQSRAAKEPVFVGNIDVDGQKYRLYRSPGKVIR